ncbi:hypothetical protein BP5796_13067 [Coleophoma crateriformis]|uniref:HSF-type DNA-binding domain-containing protein n=1 Tax=Coleophoma crateriformis TaxID=565419 RepID=A0A3D8Q445_9HELO|nr:hypothetical protein BP5796_13067 [Coleophoma crateriformis]
MPSTNPRKRAAPGAPPAAVQTPLAQQSLSAANQLPNDDFIRWQGAENGTYPDPASYNINPYGGGNTLSQPQFGQPAPGASTQLARRPMNRQLVATNQRAGYDGAPWDSFNDDPSGASGILGENDDIDLLEERAAIAKREAQASRKQIPPFIQKLSSFLDVAKNTELIRWSDRGDSFVVLDEDEFAKTLIPELFKHNNYASFVRQLNMYGFHKRVGLSDNSMKASERKNKSPSEYYSPYFKRGHPNLLWLINKPKGASKSGRESKAKGSNQTVENDSPDEDAKEAVDGEFFGNYGPGMPNQSRAISATPESGPLQKREVLAIRNQLAEVQKNQGAITTAINRLRKDYNAMYQQSVAFQTLHDRHESSINAILTFLATVYNRSLDGQGPQNLQQMAQSFAEKAQNQHGSVVDMGDINNQPETADNQNPHRRAQRLLMPPMAGRATTLSPPAAPAQDFDQFNGQNSRPGAVEELFDITPGDYPQVKVDPEQAPRQEMMNLINNTNAQAASPGVKLDFPEILSQYENSNGNSPLTPEERSNVLNLIARQTSGPNANNALVSPSPPVQPSLAEMSYTQQELDSLLRLQQENDARINNAHSMLPPLSPSEVMPGGMMNGHYFSGDGMGEGQGSNDDLDQFLDAGAYYNNGSPVPDFNYDGYVDSKQVDPNFNFGLESTPDDSGRIVETTGSSEAGTSPDDAMNVDDAPDEVSSPIKKRRRAA